MVHKKLEDISVFKGIFNILRCTVDYRSMLLTDQFHKNKGIF